MSHPFITGGVFRSWLLSYHVKGTGSSSADVTEGPKEIIIIQGQRYFTIERTIKWDITREGKGQRKGMKGMTQRRTLVEDFLYKRE